MHPSYHRGIVCTINPRIYHCQDHGRYADDPHTNNLSFIIKIEREEEILQN